jgi:hypothetical protein
MKERESTKRRQRPCGAAGRLDQKSILDKKVADQCRETRGAIPVAGAGQSTRRTVLIALPVTELDSDAMPAHLWLE